MVDEQGREEGRPGGASRQRGRPVLLLAVGALVIGGSGLGLALSDSGANAAAPITCGASTPRLTVQGTGESSATPDLLTIVFQINETGPTATAALTQDNAKTDDAIFALTGNGVARKNIQTTNLSIQTQYAYPKGVQTITGYQVSNTVTATTTAKPTKAGGALDALVGAVGNSAQINSLSFSFSNPAQVESKARAAAVRQAVRHATAMAAAAGRRLGPVCSLTDNTTPPLTNQQQNFGFPALGATSIAGSAAPPVPLEAGTQNETDQVTLVYAVQSN
jgi:uncharacterized protein YggE